MMIRIIIAAALLLAGIGAISAQLSLMGVGPSQTAAGGASNLLLLVDGSSKLLQTDGASRVCLAGGC